MELTLDTVRKVARLARLDLSDQDLERYRQEMASLLDDAAVLDEVDTTDTRPMVHPLEARLVLAEDRAQPSNGLEVLEAVAPESKEHQVLVPIAVAGAEGAGPGAP